MTEEQWLACAYPRDMLDFLREGSKASDRKLRLFAAACCRRIWNCFLDDRCRRAVQVAEWYADQLVGSDVLSAAAKDSEDASSYELGDEWHEDPFYCAGLDAAHATWSACTDSIDAARYGANAYAASVASHAWQDDWPRQHPDCIVAEKAERTGQASILRDLFGSLFLRPITLPRAVLSWNGGTVVRLAQAVYENRTLPAGTFDNTRLAVLADGLEEAGCTDAQILMHLRGGGEHYRGCWALDLLLGKD